MRIHTEGKPVICKTCGKEFTETGTLRTQVMIHTEVKPDICKTCGKEFMEAGTL